MTRGTWAVTRARTRVLRRLDARRLDTDGNGSLDQTEIAHAARAITRAPPRSAQRAARARQAQREREAQAEAKAKREADAEARREAEAKAQDEVLRPLERRAASNRAARKH